MLHPFPPFFEGTAKIVEGRRRVSFAIWSLPVCLSHSATPEVALERVVCLMPVSGKGLCRGVLESRIKACHDFLGTVQLVQ